MDKSIYSSGNLLLRKILHDARVSKNITQTDVACRLDKPQSYVSKYENGEKMLTVFEFIYICDALEIKAEDIIKELRDIEHL